MSSMMYDSRVESYDELIQEVESYGISVDSADIEEDEDFQYLTLESRDSELHDITVAGNALDAISVAEIKDKDTYKLSIPK